MEKQAQIEKLKAGLNVANTTGLTDGEKDLLREGLEALGKSSRRGSTWASLLVRMANGTNVMIKKARCVHFQGDAFLIVEREGESVSSMFNANAVEFVLNMDEQDPPKD